MGHPEHAAEAWEITQTLYRYARAIDDKDFDALRDVFAPDAIIHYDLPGGARKPLAEMIEWLRGAMSMFRATQHLLSNPLVTFEEDGEGARSQVYLHATHEQLGKDGRTSTFVDTGLYEDTWRRTPRGWRITHRHLRRILLHGEIQAPDRVEHFERGPLA